MIIDCHNHSNASMDGEFTVEEMLNGAYEKNVDVFAITDHCELDLYLKENLEEKIPLSFNNTKAAKEHSKIKLLCGIEIGQGHAFTELADTILNKYDFDMVIGSLHTLKEKEDFYWLDYKALNDDELYSLIDRYFDELYEFALWNGFDTLAHIGYPYRYIIKDERLIESILPKHFEKKIEAVFKLLIKNKKALENNTSASQTTAENKAINRYFLELYYKTGGQLITAGSDAHCPQNVGNGVVEGAKALKEIGFESITYFEKRKPILVKI